ncbi:DUF2163 domain-containing protein [Phaeobacter sp. 11ANDIMAR09]|uniref:DUF2163 domain-containing protein n=1 Tax=Phaeobacter sp. 11ANDIMAR09 TaxID=1225647 RepID=UPI0006C8809F|nr:DUF2163 domain-containing protein [Phaeobacter sp. 11ANDIMAR09]KPD12415.1 hypothetical protein AN476_10945 [Phaeobacter sp. 11ANDIMAR09]
MAEIATEALRAHLQTGVTTLARCWGLTRRDGTRFGFTDHDRDLSFDGWTFSAGTGLSARAVVQSTGLSVDNSSALGALSDTALREADILSGRFDGADLNCWLVNWQNTQERWLQFGGSIGELHRAGGAFEAELRGLTEALNQPLGRIYQKTCTAVLGDGDCRFDLSTPGYAFEGPIETVTEAGAFQWRSLEGFEQGWFVGGRLTVLSGEAAGLWGSIKRDQQQGAARTLTLWEPLRAGIAVGDQLRLDPGCDKSMQSCRLKFNNLGNFQGFPDIPGEDWVMAVPKSSGNTTGGSRR